MSAATFARTAFVAGLGGLPLWWVLGLVDVVPLLMAGPLAWDLAHRRHRQVPPGFGWWLLFLLWVTLGVGVLWTTAPGTADEGGIGRLLVFDYRLAWYLSATVLLLWLCTVGRRELPDRVVHRLFAWVFVVATLGGLLGILAPDLVIPTPAEQLLPGGLRSNEFVSSLVVAEAADVQQVLGEPSPRPKAPFAYTNTWGSVISLSLVFLLAALAGLRGRWRWACVLAVVAAIPPIVLSLNRGLWITLATGILGALLLLVVRRRPALAVTASALVLVGVVAVALTPLGEVYQARLENPHSNDRRTQLLVATVESVTTGSPVVGFGSTRDVQGSFSSIAGGATPECPACGVPPLGTQGQLWLVIFSQGWPGLLFFLAFLVQALGRSIRCRTRNETIATFVVVGYLLQLTVYDTLGIPLLIVMSAIALVWRERVDVAPERTRAPAAVRRRAGRVPTAGQAAALAVAGLLGAATAAAVTYDRPTETTATVSVELTPPPTYLDARPVAVDPTDDLRQVEVPNSATIDTEAALVVSEATLRLAADGTGLPTNGLRRALRIEAPPLSSVLDITVTTATDADPAAAAEAVATAYLEEREVFLEQQRADLIGVLRSELEAVEGDDPVVEQTRRYLQGSIDRLETHRPPVGEVIRRSPATAVPVDRNVPLTSGFGIGVLCGVAVLRARTRRRHP